MNAHELAVKENGTAIVENTTYAVFNQPEIVDHMGRAVYQAVGFTADNMDDRGEFDPLFHDHVVLHWDCNEWYNSEYSADDWDGDWENGATISK